MRRHSVAEIHVTHHVGQPRLDTVADIIGEGEGQRTFDPGGDVGGRAELRSERAADPSSTQALMIIRPVRSMSVGEALTPVSSGMAASEMGLTAIPVCGHIFEAENNCP